MHLTKMQGLGNDYLYVYGEVENPAELSVKWADRHFGIGSDGLILIQDSEVADFKMRIFNADGSEAKMCGNGIRCVGKFVYDKGYTSKTILDIETLSGIRRLKLDVKDGLVQQATVEMGEAVVEDAVTLTALEQEVSCVPVSVGNPHCIVFCDDADNAPLCTIGAALEKHEHFPQGVNVEFVQILDRHRIRMRVWERGSGITMACGTGACASAAAAVKAGFCDSPLIVRLDGGELNIEILPDGSARMTGPAVTVAECEVED